MSFKKGSLIDIIDNIVRSSKLVPNVIQDLDGSEHKIKGNITKNSEFVVPKTFCLGTCKEIILSTINGKSKKILQDTYMLVLTQP